MSESAAPNENFDHMTTADFEARLPDLFANGTGNVSQDPRFERFLAANPDCLALVKDLEAIATFAKGMFEPAVHEPSDAVWSNIASKLRDETSEGAVDLSE